MRSSFHVPTPLELSPLTKRIWARERMTSEENVMRLGAILVGTNLMSLSARGDQMYS